MIRECKSLLVPSRDDLVDPNEQFAIVRLVPVGAPEEESSFMLRLLVDPELDSPLLWAAIAKGKTLRL